MHGLRLRTLGHHPTIKTVGDDDGDFRGWQGDGRSVSMPMDALQAERVLQPFYLGAQLRQDDNDADERKHKRTQPQKQQTDNTHLSLIHI